MPNLIPIIGLEIHVELKTKSKMFCSCLNDPFIETPNVNICEVCLAHPGTLPVPNKTALEWTAKIARALNCTIASTSKFDRKHYFYPDLPKGYQISQYDQPIGSKGFINLDLTGTSNHRPEAKIGITRVHLEEDTAKMAHDPLGNSLVDFNRAGVPLVEIVSEPEIESAEEAKLYCQELQLIFRALGVSAAEMEKGQMRCEANISVQEKDQFTIENGIVKPLGSYKLNAKVELKNINSFKAIERAIQYEIKRQGELVEKGEEWLPETRGWDDAKGISVFQRSKESAADYRYFPEPDIPPFNPTSFASTDSLPELPQVKRLRFTEEYGFSKADADLLSSSEYWADYTEQVMSELIEWIHSQPDNKASSDAIAENKKQQLARLAGGWLTTKLAGLMSERKIDIRILKLKPEN
jgi:aspartyl-tRNA(Asn)/glutamyl-tRNA(Gln) amidotransferase subunit B